jgi:hypothetical protein
MNYFEFEIVTAVTAVTARVALLHCFMEGINKRWEIYY